MRGEGEEREKDTRAKEISLGSMYKVWLEDEMTGSKEGRKAREGFDEGKHWKDCKLEVTRTKVNGSEEWEKKRYRREIYLTTPFRITENRQRGKELTKGRIGRIRNS